jgi:hypothetical protein
MTTNLMTLEQAAQYMDDRVPKRRKNPVDALYRTFKRGQIPGERTADGLCFKQADLDDYLQKYSRWGMNRKEWPDEIIAQMGKRPDPALAKELGVSTRTVARKRQSLGIAPYDPWI